MTTMDTTTVPAIVALALGTIGLIVCSLAMSRLLTGRAGTLLDEWRRPAGRTVHPPPESATPPVRRVITGPTAAERLTPDARPARHPAMRPDVLRQERERLSTEAARRTIDQFADQDPAALADVVDHLLAADRDGTGTTTNNATTIATNRTEGRR